MACVVAIPALNEEKHILACLRALDTQVGARLDHIVVYANNCRDRTASAARSANLTSGVKLHVVEAELPPDMSNAGLARRRAMDVALPLAGSNGILFCTDADGQVDPDWLGASLKAISQGADVVAGWAELDPLDWGRIPVQLHEDDARECAYDALCDEIHARLDPDPFDPMPRHTQHSGASIAVTVQSYLRCGGIPEVISGEDRALIAALRRVDAKVRHDSAVRVVVSGRTVGRAVGGMADTIKRRLEHPDTLLDDRLEPATICARRAHGRAELRRAFDCAESEPAQVAEFLQLPETSIVQALQMKFFGQAWEAVEDASPALPRLRVPVVDLEFHKVVAEQILETLRARSTDVNLYRLFDSSASAQRKTMSKT